MGKFDNFGPFGKKLERDIKLNFCLEFISQSLLFFHKIYIVYLVVWDRSCCLLHKVNK